MNAGSTLLLLLCVASMVLAQETPIPPVPDEQPKPPFPPVPEGSGPRMLRPGFVVRELPVQLTSLNNVEYAPDGRLFAAGYDGRLHVLRDTDGDGLEEQVVTFQPEAGPNYPIGMAVKDGEPYVVLTDEVVRWRDTDGDGTPDTRETVASGFDDPEMVSAPYLNHRRVDSSLAIAFGPDGALYVTMGNAGYDNPYWTDQEGVAHYATEHFRGCLVRLAADGTAEKLNSGLRYIMSLQFNAAGDLFGADQEGATWVPNGNPFDELLHIEEGRHYGFPPRHPQWLPDVVDEPSVWDYGPQHQSTCGFRFNGPAEGRGRFGPESWAGDALVTGESRGKLWRTTLAKTAAGYVARNELFAQLGVMPVDCTLSPAGDLVVCCHTGKPDWGNGPQGEGRLYKISYEADAAPQPLLVWPASETETVVEFDRPLAPDSWKIPTGEVLLEGGRYVAAGDALESFRPGYKVVEMQQEHPRSRVPVTGARIEADGRRLIIESAPRRTAFHHALSFRIPQGGLHLAHDLSGVEATWKGDGAEAWSGWLPHPDLAAAKQFTRGSAFHDPLWMRLEGEGSLAMRGQLDLWKMLIPATQPISELGYEPAPETVTLVFRSDAALALTVPGHPVEKVSDHESRLTVTAPQEHHWPELILRVVTPVSSLDLSWHTARDERPRALSVGRVLLPFAKPDAEANTVADIPEIAGGDWKAGEQLYHGKATCMTCHQIRGSGARVGPDLNTLIHADYASLLRNIGDPNASINPDAVGYIVKLRDGSTVTGTRVGESADELRIAQPGGVLAILEKEDILGAEPMDVSLMPAGLDKLLTAEELRDLMTFLLTEGPH